MHPFNNTSMTSDSNDGPPRWLLTLFSVVLACCSIACICVNGICFVLFTKHRDLLGNQANKLVFNLVISTLTTSVIVMPFSFISYASNEWLFKDFFCQTTGLFSITMPVVQQLTLCSMAYDRYHYIVNPLTYLINMTSFKANVIIFFTWFVAIVSGLMPLFGWGEYSLNRDVFTCTVQWTSSSSFSVYYFALSFVLPLFVQAYCYGGIIRVAKKQAKFGRRLSRVAVVPVQVSRIIRETSASKTIHKTFIIIGLFLLTWMPYIFIVLLRGILRADGLGTALFIVSNLTYITCLAYPLLFVFRAKAMQKDLRTLLRNYLFFLCINDVAPEEIDSSEPKGRRRSSLSLDGYDFSARRRSSRVSKVSWAMPIVNEDGQEPAKEPRPSLTASTVTTDISSLQGVALLPGELDYGYRRAINNCKETSRVLK